MKLSYKIIIPLAITVLVLFTALILFFLHSEKTIMKEAQTRNSEKIIEQFENDKKNRLLEEEQNIKFLAKMVAKVSSKYVYDFDMESIDKTLKDFLAVKNIYAIEVYEKGSKEVFSLVYKDNNKIYTKEDNNYNYKQQYVPIKEKIFWDEEQLELGYVVLYYDNKQIINEFKKSKETLFKKLEESNAQQEHDANVAIFDQIIFLVLIAVILFAIIFYMTYKTVLQPLKVLHQGLNNFFAFLQNEKDHAEKIEIKTDDEFGKMAESLNENIAVSAKLHEEIYELNTSLEARIEERTKKISSLLDNADQGFLSFSTDLIIDFEYSKECKKIFKKDIAGVSIGELLYPQEKEKREFFETTLSSLFAETNGLKIKNILSLLQSEFRINKKAIHVKYKLIEKNRFMLIFTDITANKILERKINKEKDTLKMIVSVISDSDEFFELIDDFKEFYENKLTYVDKTKTPLHNTTVLYRMIHTFKGLFLQKDMKSLSQNLHQFENSLSELLTSQNNTNDTLTIILKDAEFKAWLDVELDIIKQILGDELFDKKGKIVVKESTISKIENELSKITKKSGLTSEYKNVLTDIKNLKNKPLYTMFNSYVKLVSQLSNQLGKSIYALDVIVNKDILVKDEIKPFVKSLVHIFRNCVDHGIESMDERYENGKDEIGTITCSIKENDDTLSIIIADDGKGIDIKQIKQKAQSLGIDTTKMTDKEILYLIFEDKLSTSNELSTISGRGIGMSAVKEELENLNGKINISTQLGVGTTFEFIIPK